MPNLSRLSLVVFRAQPKHNRLASKFLKTWLSSTLGANKLSDISEKAADMTVSRSCESHGILVSGSIFDILDDGVTQKVLTTGRFMKKEEGNRRGEGRL